MRTGPGLRSACALTLCLLACDGRVEQPRAASGSPAQPASGSLSVVATAAAPSAPAAPLRCIRPTTDEPERPAPPPGPAAGCPEPTPFPELATASLRFLEASGGPLELTVELARRDEERQRGLMYRTQLADDRGMLFVFERERRLAFWMKNTCIALDMIFVAADGLIVGIEENVPTLNENTYSPGCPAKYVIEVNAGWTRKRGIRAGQRVELPPL